VRRLRPGWAGLWIIRDRREPAELGLPEGPPFEVPLLIQDRNFGLDEAGRLTGRLVHKTDPEVMEAFAPFTVVTGKVWPLLEVQAATYRLRVLNGSNAAPTGWCFSATVNPNSTGSPRSAPTTGCSALRARARRTGSCSRRPSAPTCSSTSPAWSLAASSRWSTPPPPPFDGAPFRAANARNAADPGRMLPYPHVMRFRVVPGPVTRQTIPAELATDYRPPAPDAVAGAPRRTIALVERELEGEPSMLTMRELAIAGDDHAGPAVTVTDGEQTTRYRIVRRSLRGRHDHFSRSSAGMRSGS